MCQLRFFSVVEISLKHSSLYNNSVLPFVSFDPCLSYMLFNPFILSISFNLHLSWTLAALDQWVFSPNCFPPLSVIHSYIHTLSPTLSLWKSFIFRLSLVHSYWVLYTLNELANSISFSHLSLLHFCGRVLVYSLYELILSTSFPHLSFVNSCWNFCGFSRVALRLSKRQSNHLQRL